MSQGRTVEIPRDRYLKTLIDFKHLRQVKVITGIRRCGKSFLLRNIFKKHLIRSGVPANRIIEIDLEDYGDRRFRDPDTLYNFVVDRAAL